MIMKCVLAATLLVALATPAVAQLTATPTGRVCDTPCDLGGKILMEHPESPRASSVWQLWWLWIVLAATVPIVGAI